MSFYVEPGNRFVTTYVSDGIQTRFPVPDVTADTDSVMLYINGLIQVPVEHFTCHQGNLDLVIGAVPAGYNLMIRNA